MIASLSVLVSKGKEEEESPNEEADVEYILDDVFFLIPDPDTAGGVKSDVICCRGENPLTKMEDPPVEDRSEIYMDERTSCRRRTAPPLNIREVIVMTSNRGGFTKVVTTICINRKVSSFRRLSRSV